MVLFYTPIPLIPKFTSVCLCELVHSIVSTCVSVGTLLCGHCGDTVVWTLCGHCGDTVVGTLLCGHCVDIVGTLLCGHCVNTVGTLLCVHCGDTVVWTLCGHWGHCCVDIVWTLDTVAWTLWGHCCVDIVGTLLCGHCCVDMCGHCCVDIIASMNSRSHWQVVNSWVSETVPPTFHIPAVVNL